MRRDSTDGHEKQWRNDPLKMTRILTENEPLATKNKVTHETKLKLDKEVGGGDLFELCTSDWDDSSAHELQAIYVQAIQTIQVLMNFRQFSYKRLRRFKCSWTSGNFGTSDSDYSSDH